MHQDMSLDIVIKELQAIRAEMTSQTKSISALETNMKGLLDNGQPGRITRMETRISSLEHFKFYLMGYAALLGALAYLTKDAWLLALGFHIVK